MRFIGRDIVGSLIAFGVLTYFSQRMFDRKKEQIPSLYAKIIKSVVGDTIQIFPTNNQKYNKLFELYSRDGYKRIILKLKDGMKNKTGYNPAHADKLLAQAYLVIWYSYIHKLNNSNKGKQLIDSIKSLTRGFLQDFGNEQTLYLRKENPFFNPNYDGNIRLHVGPYTNRNIPEEVHCEDSKGHSGILRALECGVKFNRLAGMDYSDLKFRGPVSFWYVIYREEHEVDDSILKFISNIYTNLMDFWKDSVLQGDTVLMYSAFVDPEWYMTEGVTSILRNRAQINVVSLPEAKVFTEGINYKMLYPEWAKSFLYLVFKRVRWQMVGLLSLYLLLGIIIILPYMIVLVIAHDGSVFGRNSLLRKGITTILTMFAFLPPFVLPHVLGTFQSFNRIIGNVMLIISAVVANGITFQIFIAALNNYVNEKNALYFLMLNQLKVKFSKSPIKMILMYPIYMLSDVFRCHIKSPNMERYVYSAMNFHLLHILLKYSVFIIDSVMVAAILVSWWGEYTPGEMIIQSFAKKGLLSEVYLWTGLYTIMFFVFILKLFVVLLKYRLYPDILQEVE